MRSVPEVEKDSRELFCADEFAGASATEELSKATGGQPLSHSHHSLSPAGRVGCSINHTSMPGETRCTSRPTVSLVSLAAPQIGDQADLPAAERRCAKLCSASFQTSRGRSPFLSPPEPVTCLAKGVGFSESILSPHPSQVNRNLPYCSEVFNRLPVTPKRRRRQTVSIIKIAPLRPSVPRITNRHRLRNIRR